MRYTVTLADREFENYLDKKLFSKKKVELNFLTFETPEYYQLFGDFISDLSIVDLLFNEGKEGREVIVDIEKDATQ